MTVHKLRISFTGIASNALDDLAKLDRLASEHEEYEDDGLTYSAKACISAYRDTILALIRQDTTIAEVKDFWFHNTDPAQVSYDDTVIKFAVKDALQASEDERMLLAEA